MQLPAHQLLKDPAFLGIVGSLLKSIRKEYEQPLGFLPASKFQLVCTGGVTIDFAKPYSEQVRESSPADRNNHLSPFKFVHPSDPCAQLREQLGLEISQFLNSLAGTDADITGEVVVERFGKQLMELMEKGDPVLRHFYFEPAGGQLGSTAYLSEAI